MTTNFSAQAQPTLWTSDAFGYTPTPELRPADAADGMARFVPGSCDGPPGVSRAWTRTTCHASCSHGNG